MIASERQVNDRTSNGALEQRRGPFRHRGRTQTSIIVLIRLLVRRVAIDNSNFFQLLQLVLESALRVGSPQSDRTKFQTLHDC